MSTVLCYLLFVYLTYKGFALLYSPAGFLRSPLDRTQLMKCTGCELLLVFILSTNLIGLNPVLSLRLAILEVLCVLGILRCNNRPIVSPPLILFFVFLGWVILGITYTPSPQYGVRMLLKYIFPLLMCLLASAVVRNGEIFLRAMINARKVALASFIVCTIPFLPILFGGVFWTKAPLATNYITIAIFSLGLAYFTNERKRNLLWFVLFCLPCVLWVFRTDIMGTMIALSAFFLIKNRLKALPVIVVLACLSVVSIFFIPSVKEKMFFHPEKVSVTDFLTNNIDEDNINTSGRKKVWEDCERWFYAPSPIIGSGTGRVQTYFYEEASGWRRGGQLHNDFLVMRCDNGLIGISLFILSYVAIFFHCVYIYHKRHGPIIRLCVLTAGASLFGVMITMYSDNTISYSMATLSYPWALYGTALGLIQAQKQKA